MFLWKEVGNGGYERVKVGLEVKLREICILVMAACENCKVCKGLFF